MIIPKLNGETGCDKYEANTKCIKNFKPSSLAKEREGKGGRGVKLH